ncbi:MAG: chorismate mutase family protein [Acidobacteria bacterium]|nr:chorismate mutase family protein [Acidobacteriota bacterium]
MDAKPPRECRTLAEIRQEIDRIDRGIIRAIGERKQYVMAAAAFKKNPAEVAAPERFAAMLAVRRQWAEEVGISPDVVERLYRDLVGYFIAEEQGRWAETAGQEG